MKMNTAPQNRGAKILLLDDDLRLLQALTISLRALGYRCIACENASEAISHFSLSQIDLVITDMTMPAIDGLGFIGLIRAHSEVPIIVVTGHSDDYSLRLSCQRNVTVLQKPFSPGILMNMVRSQTLQVPAGHQV